MDAFKVENFETANPGSRFPSYYALSKDECALLRERMQRRFGVTAENGTARLAALDRRLEPIEQVNAQEEGFDLERVLRQVNVLPPEYVLINWYHFDAIDRFRFDDLARQFDDIWYPASDDIEIFDELISWMVAISHDGHIRCIVER